MAVFMKPYAKGDRVEVVKRNRAMEDSWHLARIIGVHGGEVSSVLYEGHPNGVKVVQERVLGKCIRPRPPVVEFEDRRSGDLVHVFDEFVWKMAVVLCVFEAKKRFLVRVVGSLKDLEVGVGSIRVRHYWQGDKWIVVGRGPANCDVKLPNIRSYKASDLAVKQRSTSAKAAARKSKLHVSDNLPTKTIKRSALDEIHETLAWRGLTKISRTDERTSSSMLNRNQREACTETVMRSKVTEEHQETSHPPATNSTRSKAEYLTQEDSDLSSVGSCSVDSNCSINHHLRKIIEIHFAKDDDDSDDDVSDAESRTGPNPEPRNRNSNIFVSGKAMLNRPVGGCGMILRGVTEHCQGAALQVKDTIV